MWKMGEKLKALTLSYEHTERQRLMQVNGDAWEWVWDPFWSVTMHFNGP